MSPHVHSYRWCLSAVSPAMTFLSEDENLCKQMTAVMPYQRLDSALHVSRQARYEFKKNATDLEA